MSLNESECNAVLSIKVLDLVTERSAATQVMPVFCHLTIDQEKKVRDEAFKLLNEFVEKVRRVSENPAVIDEIESELEVSYSNNKFPNTLAGAWASWAVSSFTSKLSLSKSANKPDSKPASSSLPSNNSTNPTTNNGVKKLGGQPPISHAPAKSEEKKSDASDCEAWDDADDRLSLSSKESRSMNLKSIRSELDCLKADKTDKPGWEIDDDLNGFKDEKSDPFAKDGEFGSAKSDSLKSAAHKDMRLETDAGPIRSRESVPARSKTISIAERVNKSKTLEDELFESLAEPSARKKRTGAMKLGAKRA